MAIVLRTLQAEGLVLEPLLVSHAEAMFQVLRDPAIYRYENEPPGSVAELQEHYRYLVRRRSPDGSQVWLNWVIRLPGPRAGVEGPLIGYVQATLMADGEAWIAYELNSAWWGRGLARRAVQRMLEELVATHGVRQLVATLKRVNVESMGLLKRLGFRLASEAEMRRRTIEPDEWLMQREACPPAPGTPCVEPDKNRG